MSYELTYTPAITWAAAALLLLAGAVAAVRSPGAGAKIRRALMALLALTALIAPTLAVTTREVTSHLEVYIAVDLTGSMAAEDYDGGDPRLDGVRADIQTLTEELPGARFSVISYSSTATRQLPLTTDARAVNSWAETARQEITMYSAGSAIDRPVTALTKALQTAAARSPENTRALFLLTDGESTAGEGAEQDTNSVQAFADLAPLIDGGAVLGYGTQAGGKMREYDGTAETGAGTDAPYITDPNTGGAALSRIDEQALQDVAETLGVPYVHRTAPADLSDVTAAVEDAGGATEDGRREVPVYEQLTWVAMVALAGLVAWEVFALARRFKGVRTHG